MYDLEISQASQITGVDKNLIAAIIMQESSWNKNAIYRDKDGGSSYGLMQIRLDTARDLLDEPSLTPSILSRPYTNILAGSHYLRQSFRRWRDIKDVIASYNAGKPRKNALGEYTNSKGITNVQKYVNRVMGYYKQYSSRKGKFEPINFLSNSQNILLTTSLVGLVGLVWFNKD